MVLAVLTVVLAVVSPLSPLRVVHRFVPVGRYAAGDRGVDLAGVPGQVVVSATDGTVSFSGPVAGQGVVTVRLADGRRLTYEPVSPALVRSGQRIAAGTALGRLAGSHLGCPAPACLHWGLITVSGAYADPLALLSPPAVRLLPVSGGVVLPEQAARVPGDPPRGEALGPPSQPRGGPGPIVTGSSVRSGARLPGLPVDIGGASLAAGAGALGARRLGGVAHRRARNLRASRRAGARFRRRRGGSLRRPR